MILKKEIYYKKKINVLDKFKCYDIQDRRRITYLLFGLIPVFIKDEYVSGRYENKF